MEKYLDLNSLCGSIEALEVCKLQGDVGAVCSSIADLFGCQYHVFELHLADNDTPVRFSDLPRGWEQSYLANNYLKADPVVTHCRSGTEAILWSELDYSIDLDPETARRVMDEAAGTGMRYGLTAPVHGPSVEWGYCSLASPEEFKGDLAMLKRCLKIFTSAAHCACRRIALSEQKVLEKDVGLTFRERECLEWIAKGKTSWEVAHILHVSEYTVTFHTRNAIAKLDTNNRSHAVAKAITKGLISFA